MRYNHNINIQQRRPLLMNIYDRKTDDLPAKHPSKLAEDFPAQMLQEELSSASDQYSSTFSSQANFYLLNIDNPKLVLPSSLLPASPLTNNIATLRIGTTEHTKSPKPPQINCGGASS